MLLKAISMPKIAKLDGVSVSCVSSSIYGARKKIKKKLGNV